MKNIGRKAAFSPPVPQSTESAELVKEAPQPKKKRAKRTELEDDMYFQPDEVRRFFEVVKSRRDRAIFRLTYHYGLRAHEIGLLQFSDYRERDGLLYIRRGKGSVSREHTLIPEALKPLRAYLKADRDSMPGPLFPSRQGRKGIGRSQMLKLCHKYCALAGIRAEKAHTHAWKHTAGTQLSDRGFDPRAIQDWLGHRESSSTDIYMHFSQRRRDESVEKNRDWS